MIKEWWDYTLLMRASIATRVNLLWRASNAFLRASRRPSHHHCVCCRAGRIAQRPFVLEYPHAQRNKDIRQVIETPLLGYSVVLLSLSCFLLLLWALIILVRIVLG